MKIQDHFLDDIAVLSSPGLSSILVFRQNVSTLLHFAGKTEDDTQDLLIRKLAKIICDKVKQIDHDQSQYDITITKEEISMPVSQTVMDLLVPLTGLLKKRHHNAVRPMLQQVCRMALLSCGLSTGQLKVSSLTLWRISRVSY